MMTFHESIPDARPHYPDLSQKKSFPYQETDTFLQWSEWDKLLRDHSNSTTKRGDHDGPPRMILVSPPSSTPESSPHSSSGQKHYEGRHNQTHQNSPTDHHDARLDLPPRAMSEGGSFRHHHSSRHVRYPYLFDESETQSQPDHALWQPDFVRSTLDDTALQLQRDGGDDWTDFDKDEVGSSFHLSHAPQSQDVLPAEDDDEIRRSFQSTATTDEHGFPTPPRASSLPPFASRQSDSPRYLTSRSAGESPSEIDTDLEDVASPNRWSPKRLMCGLVLPEHVEEVSYPSLVSPEGGSHRKQLLTNDSHHSAPAYLPLESKRHYHLDDVQRSCHSHHHHGSATKEFKQTMKKLLEEEYSPYYVSKTPSLLSFGSSARSLDSDATSWKRALSSRKAQRRRREWFERAESKKGKMVSNRPRSMQLVFFETRGGDDQEELVVIPEDEELVLHQEVDEMAQWS